MRNLPISAEDRDGSIRRVTENLRTGIHETSATQLCSDVHEYSDRVTGGSKPT